MASLLALARTVEILRLRKLFLVTLFLALNYVFLSQKKKTLHSTDYDKNIEWIKNHFLLK